MPKRGVPRFMPVLSPLPRSVTRPVSLLLLASWVASMAALVNRSYLHAASPSLATDLARYGSTAVWRGVYYRGDKIGFTVSQTVSTSEGFELQEDGRLQMSLLGATTVTAIHTVARVDTTFALQSFEFSLDPGTGPTVVRGRVEPNRNKGTPARLMIAITSGGGTRQEVRELPEGPVLSLNFSRLLAGGHPGSGSRQQTAVLD